MVSYEGIFFNKETISLIQQLEPKKLSRTNDEIHCTFKYHPTDDQIFNEIVGKEFELYLIGYANDEKNSGFKVSLPDELMKYYINYHEENPTLLKTPHITVSLSEDAIPMATKDLNFLPLEKPIKLTGKFGFYIKEKDKEYISFEPYTQNNLLYKRKNSTK